jgi:hypothetical protein
MDNKGRSAERWFRRHRGPLRVLFVSVIAFVLSALLVSWFDPPAKQHGPTIHSSSLLTIEREASTQCNKATSRPWVKPVSMGRLVFFVDGPEQQWFLVAFLVSNHVVLKASLLAGDTYAFTPAIPGSSVMASVQRAAEIKTLASPLSSGAGGSRDTSRLDRKRANSNIFDQPKVYLCSKS